MSIQEYWQKLPERARTELVSASHTVVSAMVVELGIQLSANQDVFTSGQFTKAGIVALVAAVVRSGLKAGVSFVASQLNKE